LALANLFVWLAIAGNWQKKNLEVWFFDVGQGDAALAQLPGGVQILIDGGPSAAVLEKLGRAMPFYDRDIEWLVLSHTDRDHLTGVLAALMNYRVRNIVWSGIADEDAEDGEWRRLIADEGANIVVAEAGKKLVLANPFAGGSEAVLEILAPTVNAAKTDIEQNELSAVVKLTYGKRSFLFPGDAKSSAGGFIEAASLVQADVLKVAHHGSKYSTAAGFLAQLMPAAAVISAGAGNPYGHPSPQVLEMLAEYDIKTLRTDRNGDILFRTDGNNIFVKTEK
jgi:competence protein ComEC